MTLRPLLISATHNPQATDDALARIDKGATLRAAIIQAFPIKQIDSDPVPRASVVSPLVRGPWTMKT